MKGDEIPITDHVARLCSFKTLREDGQPGPNAFKLRESELYLSVNWLEYLQCDTPENAIQKIRSVYRLKRKVKPSAKMAIINVGEMKLKVHDDTPDQKNLSVKHEPETEDESHSGVYNFLFDEELIPILISQTIKEVYPA
jgi:hypothetical protein